MSSLKGSSIGRGLLWVGIEKFGYSGIYFISTIILARILTPEDFGLISIIAIFFSFAQMIVESGLGGALVRKKEVDDIDYHTIFTFNLGCAVVLYWILFLIAPLIANFYNNLDLILIVRVVAVNVIISALTLTQRVHLIRALQFRKQTLISVVSLIIAVFFSILSAYHGYGVWALVFQQILYNFFYFIFIFLAVKFKPRLHFSKSSFSELYGFGSKLFLSSLIQVVYNDSISSIIAKVYTIVTTGYYYQAKKIVDFPVNVFRSLGDNVVFPVLSRASTDFQLRDISTKITRVITILSFPFFLILIFFSEEIVKVILGDKWLQSAYMLSILSISSLALIIESISRNIIKSTGKGSEVLKSEIYKKVIGFSLILIALRFGLEYVLYSIVASNFFGCIINMYYVSKNTTYNFMKQLKDIFPATAYSIFALLLVKMSVDYFEFSGIVELIAIMLFMAVYYLLILIIFKAEEIAYLKKKLNVK